MCSLSNIFDAPTLPRPLSFHFLAIADLSDSTAAKRSVATDCVVVTLSDVKLINDRRATTYSSACDSSHCINASCACLIISGDDGEEVMHCNADCTCACKSIDDEDAMIFKSADTSQWRPMQ